MESCPSDTAIAMDNRSRADSADAGTRDNAGLENARVDKGKYPGPLPTFSPRMDRYSLPPRGFPFSFATMTPYPIPIAPAIRRPLPTPVTPSPPILQRWQPQLKRDEEPEEEPEVERRQGHVHSSAEDMATSVLIRHLANGPRPDLAAEELRALSDSEMDESDYSSSFSSSDMCPIDCISDEADEEDEEDADDDGSDVSESSSVTLGRFDPNCTYTPPPENRNYVHRYPPHPYHPSPVWPGGQHYRPGPGPMRSTSAIGGRTDQTFGYQHYQHYQHYQPTLAPTGSISAVGSYTGQASWHPYRPTLPLSLPPGSMSAVGGPTGQCFGGPHYRMRQFLQQGRVSQQQSVRGADAFSWATGTSAGDLTNSVGWDTGNVDWQGGFSRIFTTSEASGANRR